MRQAGRYLPEYRQVRSSHGFVDICTDPDLAVEVSMQPMRRFALDAAIIFSDILLPLNDCGVRFDFRDGLEVTLLADIRDQSFLAGDLGTHAMATVTAITRLQAELLAAGSSAAVLGFCGAPWTLLSYVLRNARQLAWSEPQLVHTLLERLSELMAQYLLLQIQAGVDAVQVFDTAAGDLGTHELREFSLPYVRHILSRVAAARPDVPTIFYTKNSQIAELATCGAHVLSIDWRTDLLTAEHMLENTPNNTVRCLQGNLDPLMLTLPDDAATARDSIRAATRRILHQRTKLKMGHIMNLGHGITPEARIPNVDLFLNTIQEGI